MLMIHKNLILKSGGKRIATVLVKYFGIVQPVDFKRLIEHQTMARKQESKIKRRPRCNHSPAFKAKVAVAAICMRGSIFMLMKR